VGLHLHNCFPHDCGFPIPVLQASCLHWPWAGEPAYFAFNMPFGKLEDASAMVEQKHLETVAVQPPTHPPNSSYPGVCQRPNRSALSRLAASMHGRANMADVATAAHSDGWRTFRVCCRWTWRPIGVRRHTPRTSRLDRTHKSQSVISRHQQARLTYDKLDRDSNALARGFANVGIKKGDRCAVMLGNSIEYATVRS